MYLHALTRRTLGRLVVAMLIALLAGAVALHHSGLAAGDGDAHHGHHGGADPGAVASMCVGMAVAAVAVEGLLLVRRSRRNARHSRRRPFRRLLPRSGDWAALHAPLARAGPPLHLQLCVIRR